MATKTLQVNLVDLETLPIGAGTAVTGEVWAEYSHELRTTDGKTIPRLRKVEVVPATGVVEFEVIPNDDPSIPVDLQGFVVTVGWSLTYRGGNGRPVRVNEYGRSILVTSADTDPVNFAAKTPVEPVPPQFTTVEQLVDEVEAAEASAAASATSAAAAQVAAEDAASLVGAPADTTMATILGNPASESATTLNATFAPAPVVSPPAGFALSVLPSPTVQRLGAGRFLASLNVAALRPPAGVTYYVSPTGSDANAGTSPAAPITLQGAFGKADVGTIIYAPGEYLRNTHSFGGPTVGKNINHLASGPGVRVTGWNSPGSTVWTLTSGSIYQTTRSTTNQIVDVLNRTSWGDYTKYEKKADLASITGPGQWAIVGSTVYCWALGNTNLTVDANRYQLRLGLSGTYTGLYADGGTHYVKGIDYEGNAFGMSAINGARIVAEDCSVRYSPGDGVYTSGGRFVGIRCESTSNALDGLSYTGASEFIEVDVTSHHNGHTGGATTNNATSSHGTCRGVRVNGDYDVAGGPVVADVNSARTWNLGCRSGDSTAPATQDQSWRADAVGYEGAPAQMWLDECTSDTAAYAYKATAGLIHLHATRHRNPGATDPDTTGVVDFYTPA